MNSHRPFTATATTTTTPHAFSVRDLIINDEDSTLALLEMVKEAYSVLIKDKRYHAFLNLLSEAAHADEHLRPVLEEASNRQLLLCGSAYDDIDFTKEALIQIVDCYVIELLRFLAMKVLLECNGGDEDEGRGNEYEYQSESRDDDRGNLLKQNRNLKAKEFVLVPSATIRAAWKAMCVLPVMYNNVCAVMGCEESLDFNHDNEILEYPMFESTDEEIAHSRMSYRYTLATYEKLYQSDPEAMFWCRLKTDETSDYDTSLTDDLANIFDTFALRVKKSMGIETGEKIPRSIKLHSS